MRKYLSSIALLCMALVSTQCSGSPEEVIIDDDKPSDTITMTNSFNFEKKNRVAE